MILLMYSNFSPTASHLARLEALFPNQEVAIALSEEHALSLAPMARVILGHRYFKQTLPMAPHLAWVQSTAGGVDHLACPGLLSKKIILTRCPIHSDVVAAHALAMAWALLRGLPAAVRQQDRQLWLRPLPTLPMPRRAMVLGMGEIGRRVARLLTAYGIRVHGVDRRSGPWRPHLPDMDACFLCLPLDRHTRHFLDAAALEALPNHAIVINVGRVETLDLEALRTLLTQGKLAGAGLDPFSSPPSPGDPIWHTPGVLITPKSASFHPQFQSRIESFVEEQASRFQSGKPLRYRVKRRALRALLSEEP